MKRTIMILITSAFVVIVGSFLLIPFNEWLWHFKELEGGYDDEMKMFDILVFIEWPILLIVGVFLGNLLYKKSLTKSSSGR